MITCLPIFLPVDANVYIHTCLHERKLLAGLRSCWSHSSDAGSHILLSRSSPMVSEVPCCAYHHLSGHSERPSLEKLKIHFFFPTVLTIQKKKI